MQKVLSTGDELRVEGIEDVVYELNHSFVTLRSEDGYLYRAPEGEREE